MGTTCVTQSELVGKTVDRAVDEEFWALICADEDLLRAEFDALVTGGDPARSRPDAPRTQPRPVPRASGARSEQCAPSPVERGQRSPAPRQRSPPGHDRGNG